jgi:hypothetical protein
VDLRRHVRRPPRPELGRRYAGVEQQRSSRSGPGLRELLCRNHAEREAGIDELVGQLVRGPLAALDDLAEAELPDVLHAVFDAAEGAAVEEIGGVHGVAGPS